MAAISATKLRQNLYNILDSVVDTGVPVEIERKGRLLRIVAEQPGTKWDRLTAHQVVVGDPDDLVHIDWSSEWHGHRDDVR
jgi:prevent-host-death family protein